jgi:hypothetical protein
MSELPVRCASSKPIALQQGDDHGQMGRRAGFIEPRVAKHKGVDCGEADQEQQHDEKECVGTIELQKNQQRQKHSEHKPTVISKNCGREVFGGRNK